MNLTVVLTQKWKRLHQLIIDSIFWMEKIMGELFSRESEKFLTKKYV